MLRIAVLTGTRADYGLLYWTLKRLHTDQTVRLQLIVSGTHLSPEFGMTIHEIEKDKFPVTEKVEMLLSSDTEQSIATDMGLGMIGFASAYTRLKPNILIVLGDRFETFAAVAAAAPFRIPVAHIHGGESTQGAIDELYRHAITKMSHLHFVSTPEYARRLVQMGEQPQRVFNVGAPGLEQFHKIQLHGRQHLAHELNLPLANKWGILTFHPITLEANKTVMALNKILQVLDEFEDMFWIFTYPNADAQSRDIISALNNYVRHHAGRASLFKSLGQQTYLSLLKHAAVMVGNSSSGIIEAPTFKLPVVNLGNRQKGRIRAGNVLDVPEVTESKVIATIRRALSASFRKSLKHIKNPYDQGETSIHIINILKHIHMDGLVQKQFFDWPNDYMPRICPGVNNETR